MRRKLHNEDFMICTLFHIDISLLCSNRGWHTRICSARGEGKLKKSEHLQTLHVKLKILLSKYGVIVEMKSIKDYEFIDQLGGCQHLKKDPVRLCFFVAKWMAPRILHANEACVLICIYIHIGRNGRWPIKYVNVWC